jgi:hypothetical protein
MKFMDKLILSFGFLFLMACDHKKEIEISQATVVAERLSGGAYFTNDNSGNVVLCWTAGAKGNAQLYYAFYNSEKGIFEEPIVVAPSQGTGVHEESMNKVAFRKDGAVIAVYERKHPTEKNKYAGSILYTQSFDGGKSWTQEKFLHTDTVNENSRSFFDITTLADGEIGAVWLDGRLKTGADGTSLFFSKTNGRNGFQSDRLIGESVCQCCRTDIYTDLNGNAHVVYRDIESSIKGQVRDFAHVFTSDNGMTFSKPKTISQDNWIVDGCPHTGACLAGNQNKIEVVWFTAGGTPGLYRAVSTDQGKTFQPRQLVSQEALHPQISSLADLSIIVWDGTKPHNIQNHSDHKSRSDSAAKNGISLSIALPSSNGNRISKVVDEDGGEFPVLSIIDSRKSLIAYTKGGKVILRKVSY